MNSVELVIAILGGGGILGGVVALFKLRPEVTRVTVSAAEGAVIVQTSVITSLNSEVKRLREEIVEERRQCDERVERQDQEIARMRSEVEDLREAFDAIDERRYKKRGVDE